MRFGAAEAGACCCGGDRVFDGGEAFAEAGGAEAGDGVGGGVTVTRGQPVMRLECSHGRGHGSD